jgi:hypothetical protein
MRFPVDWLARLITSLRRGIGRGSHMTHQDEIGSDPRRVPPIPRSHVLDEFEGRWVATIDGEVVAAADTSRQLAGRLHSMDHRKRERAVVEYVRPTSDSYIVGVG